MKSLITGVERKSPYRKSGRAPNNKPSMETKTLESKTEKAIQMAEENDEDENSRGFTAAYDHQDHHTFRNT